MKDKYLKHKLDAEVAHVGTEQQYVIFRLMGQLFGAAIDVVREVTYLTQVTRLPNTPAYVEGVVDLRGEVLPVVDLRKRLGLSHQETGLESRLMILNLGDRSAALIVDGVDQVRTINSDQIAAPDAHVFTAGHDYVTGVARQDDALVVILDLARLMND